MLRRYLVGIMLIFNFSLYSQYVFPLKEAYAPDKLLHFGAGYVIGTTATVTADLLGSKRPYVWGVLAGAVAGAGKEYYDYRTGGRVEGMDIWMAFLGGTVATITVTYSINNKKIKIQ